LVHPEASLPLDEFQSKFGALAEFSMNDRKIFSVTNIAFVIEKVAGIKPNT